MKKYFTKMMALACMFLLGTNAWADTYTIAWGSDNGSNTTTSHVFTDNHGEVEGIISFTSVQNSAETVPAYMYKNGQYLSIKYDANHSSTNKNGAAIILTPAWGVTITSFELTARNGHTPSLEYTADGGTALIVPTTTTSDNHTVYETVSGISARKSLMFQNVATSAQECHLLTLKITYTKESWTNTTTSIDASGITNTDVNSGTSAGSLSATVTPGNGSVTWSSSNDAVATINSSGAVTLHRAGTVTFTATFEGVWGSYNPSSATYQMHVTNSQTEPNKWVETEISQLTSSDIFVIVGTTPSGNTYAFNNNLSSGTLYGTAVTISGNRISSLVPDNIKWNIEGSYKFRPNGRENIYLYYTTDYNTIRINNPSNYTAGKHSEVFGYSNNKLTPPNNSYHFSLVLNSSGKIVWSVAKNTTNEPTIKFYKLVLEPNVNVMISEIGYSTLYYGEVNLEVPEGVEAYTYTVDGSKLQSNKTYTENDVIPAGTAVVLKGNAGSYSFAITTESGEGDSQNVLKGSDLRAMTVGGNVYYALSTKGGANVGFYWINDNGAAFECPAHKAYLALDGAPTVKAFVFDDDDATGIEGVQEVQEDQGAIYNLAGQRLNKMQKGINIVNGKKILK